MSTFGWLLVASLAMSAIALVGSVTLLLKEAALPRVILVHLAAFAVGLWLLFGLHVWMDPKRPRVSS